MYDSTPPAGFPVAAPFAPATPYAPAAPGAESLAPGGTHRHRNWLFGACATVAAAGLIGASVLTGGSATTHLGAAATTSQAAGSGIGVGAGHGSTPTWGGGSPVGGPSSNETSYADATAKQVMGIVDIHTVLGYQDAAAAGTGMILSADGTILTNNHVVAGATSVEVTVLSTGKVYQAHVVGTAPTVDIAVIQLVDASGLTPAAIGSSSGLSVADSVIAVGNAGDAKGTAAAAGQITALEQSITATDESGANSEKLSGLIQTNADVVAGDSGGPLYNTNGKIIGIDTAGSSGTTSVPESYAIAIDSALSVAQRIEAGENSAVIHQGVPAFLGVSLTPAPTTTSPHRSPFGQRGGTARPGSSTIAGVVDGTPAADLGLAAGDTITAIDSTAIASADGLSAALSGYHPGDQITVSWTDSSGASHSGTATLIKGAAD
jgi:S1-C subfamily serine protease